MKKMNTSALRKVLMFVMVMCMIVTNASMSVAVSKQTVSEYVNETAKYVYQTVKEPRVGSIGGEWAVLGLARSGYPVPDKYYNDYYKRVEEYVKDLNGELHDKKYTEYSRLIVALSSIGKDARNVAGYDLTTALGDYDKTIWQGLNGPIWALIALDSRNYPMPINKKAKTQATREMYIQRILDCQLPDGGWSLFGGTKVGKNKPADKDIVGDTSKFDMNDVADPDITGMALQALAKYQYMPAVKKATEEALNCMAKKQDGESGFSSWGTTNCESAVQVLVALCELGIPFDDPRFTKNGKTLVDNILLFRNPDGGFLHVIGGGNGNNQMTTEQGFYGLVAVDRALNGKNSLYRMSDAIKVGESKDAQSQSEKNGVKVPAVTKKGVTFKDLQGAKSKTAIEELAAREILNGMTSDNFAPTENMSREQFATVVVKALGLKEEITGKFKDIPVDHWSAKYIGAAESKGIIAGTSDDTFTPSGTITKEQAAAMVARAAKLCGMNTDYDTAAARDVLAGFDDYVTVSGYAQGPLAFCYNNNILDSTEQKVEPQKMLKREEIASMVYNMLKEAKLI